MMHFAADVKSKSRWPKSKRQKQITLMTNDEPTIKMTILRHPLSQSCSRASESFHQNLIKIENHENKCQLIKKDNPSDVSPAKLAQVQQPLPKHSGSLPGSYFCILFLYFVFFYFLFIFFYFFVIFNFLIFVFPSCFNS